MLETPLAQPDRDSNLAVDDEGRAAQSGELAPLAAEPDEHDRALTETLKAALRASGVATLRGITVESHHGDVELSGWVVSYHQKQLAQVLVKRVDGVRRITNRLEVAGGRLRAD